MRTISFALVATISTALVSACTGDAATGGDPGGQGGAIGSGGAARPVAEAARQERRGTSGGPVAPREPRGALAAPGVRPAPGALRQGRRWRSSR